MNSTFEIKGSTNNSTFECKTANVIVEGSFSKNAETGSLERFTGRCYRIREDGERGTMIGHFNGHVDESDEIRYVFSKMSREDTNLVWEAIDEIIPIINTKNN